MQKLIHRHATYISMLQKTIAYCTYVSFALCASIHNERLRVISGTRKYVHPVIKPNILSENMQSFSDRERALGRHLVGSKPHGIQRRSFHMYMKPCCKKLSNKRSPEQILKDKIRRRQKCRRWARFGLDSRGFLKKHTKAPSCNLPPPIEFMESPYIMICYWHHV